MLIKLKRRKTISTKHKVVFIGIGTNKGNREKNISLALELLRQHKQIKILQISKMLKNPPQEGIKSGYFLNGAIKIKTTLTPIELLKTLKNTEKILGRNINKQIKRKTSRTIDLDILLYENKTTKNSFLTIPHPMLHKRSFVLIPLFEIGRNHIHPVFNKSISNLYKNYFRAIKKYA
ncbi:MAG: 2-amino-4-hydroxy-6-hydroxymethyldihydropteridine diphosphokinase [Candidatus Melainabacteria bacterium]|nr:2-amino-4-hydroxy-6-hydroxymethyldihydropteridine diphosphokinase [Candidatus Melainabacteria bacterium]